VGDTASLKLFFGSLRIATFAATDVVPMPPAADVSSAPATTCGTATASCTRGASPSAASTTGKSVSPTPAPEKCRMANPTDPAPGSSTVASSTHANGAAPVVGAMTSGGAASTLRLGGAPWPFPLPLLLPCAKAGAASAL